jgi:hypothetical protein
MSSRNAVLISVAALSLAGCAVDPKDPTGFATAINNVLTSASAATAMDQQLAEDFVKQTSDLEYLSKNAQSCRNSDDPIVKAIGIAAPKSIKMKEDKDIQTRLAELQLIKTYSDALLAFAKQEATRSSYIDDFNNIAAAANTTAFATPEMKVVAAAAQTIGAAFKAIGTNISNERLRQTATRMQPTLVKMVGNLKRKFHIVSDETQSYLNTWRTCTEMKFAFMRDRPAPSRQSSVVDLHNSYDAYQVQLRTYLNSVPQIGDSLDAIVKANQAIIDTSPDELVSTAQQLSTTVTGVVNGYKAVKSAAQPITSAR